MMERLVITGVGSELQGVGRLPDGRAAFVPGAIPGETVRVRVDRDKGRFCEASLLEVLEPSPDRVEPDCPYAAECGGCQARHIRYERALELKRQIVRDAMTRIGGLEAPNVLPSLGCAEPNRTRNKAEYPIALREGWGVVGAFARNSRQVVPLEDIKKNRKPRVVATSVNNIVEEYFSTHSDLDSHVEGRIEIVD